MNQTKTFKASIDKIVVEDNYKEGEIGNYQDHGIILTLENPSLIELLKMVKSHIGDSLVKSNGQLEICTQENVHGGLPSLNELKEWKEGKRTLWTANYTVYISEVITNGFTSSDYNSPIFADIETY